MEGSDLNYYFNWIKSQLSSQVSLFLVGDIDYPTEFAFSSNSSPPAATQQTSAHSLSLNWDYRILCALQCLYNLSECVCSFFCCCLCLIRTYMVQVQKQAQEQEQFPPVK